MNNSKYEDSMILALGERLFYIMILNVLWVVCCLPVVTIGASTTALNYTWIKILRDEGESVVRMFFSSFARNIRQALIIWTGMLAVLIIFGSFLIQLLGAINAGHKLAIIGAILIVLCLLLWLLLFAFVFFVLSRFENTIFRTFTNSVYLALRNPQHTVKIFFIMFFMVLILPYFLWVYFPYGFPMVIFFGAPVTAMLLAKHFNKIFEEFIPE
ncbi:MAG: YesL family protein [Solobacterium sp.]|nr:YesL family protein [Solobacterium sp.]